MAILQNKRLLLVCFFLFCLISIQARARTLKERSNVANGDANTAHTDKEAHDDTFKPKDTELVNTDGEEFSMDYTPASKKPPIHN
ncbi:hypothetical protein L6164_025062 [Bauhinia variegata]|uniref:Uncharacterized protein n=1 Tax=Bauhinia variegata TaxID=167791 RepID=A0ACB9LZG2_BAUVA|nr:hypothetical protein L6164_025062 [Bauhinia variegata]